MPDPVPKQQRQGGRNISQPTSRWWPASGLTWNQARDICTNCDIMQIWSTCTDKAATWHAGIHQPGQAGSTGLPEADAHLVGSLM